VYNTLGFFLSVLSYISAQNDRTRIEMEMISRRIHTVNKTIKIRKIFMRCANELLCYMNVIKRVLCVKEMKRKESY